MKPTLFGCSSDNVGLYLKNIYANGELVKVATAKEISVVRQEGTRRISDNVCTHIVAKKNGFA